MIPYRLISLLFLIILINCKDQKVNQADTEFPPFELKSPENEGYGWDLSTLEAEGFDPEPIKQLVLDIYAQKFVRIHDLIIVRNNKLVLDYEFSEKNVIRPGVAWLTQDDGSHYLASATKSIVATVLGIAIEQGLFESKDDLLYDHFSEYYDSFENWDQIKATITLDDLLTMRAGYKCRDGDGETMWTIQQDMIKYILDRPMDYEPGTRFQYCSGNTNVIGDIIGLKSGLGFEEFLFRYLLEPMGIDRPKYIHHEPSGKPNLSTGIFMQPRDMAKFGQLYLQNGKWNGVQLVPQEWLEFSTTPVYNIGDSRYYAHHWWVKDFRVNETLFKLPYAEGNGGQVIYPYKDLNLVIVMTGGNYDDDLRYQNQIIVEDYILPSLLD